MPSPKDYPPVDVVWYDAHERVTTSGWIDPMELGEETDMDFWVYSRGFLIEDKKTHITISRSLAVETIEPTLKIPRSCIKSIKKVKFQG